MNKEFIGQKKFYLENNPEVFIIVRLYIVETRNNEYFMAIYEDGNSFQVETFEGPDGKITKTYIDHQNKRFYEHPTITTYGVHFYDRRSDEIGVGEVGMMQIGSDSYFMGSFVPNRDFKYKKNGWDYTADKGERIEFMLEGTGMNWDKYVESGKIEFNKLENDYYQVKCTFPFKS